MFTNAGSAGLTTAEKPLAKSPSRIGAGSRAIVTGKPDEPNTVRHDQSLNPVDNSAPPASAAIIATTAAHRRILSTSLLMAVSLLKLCLAKNAAVFQRLAFSYIRIIGRGSRKLVLSLRPYHSSTAPWTSCSPL